MELYAAVRRNVYVEGLSERAAARHFGLARETVRKMLRYRRPPGYRRAQPIRRPKLDAFTGIIDQILREDQSRPKKQRHTAKRIGERLRAEYGFTGGDTIVNTYVRERRLGGQEMFVPLAHPPGDAQADFGEALVVIAGVECKAHYLVVDLPHSDDGFVKAFPAETTEAFCDGHNAAFCYFGGVSRRIVYDNTKLAVARILGDGTRQRTQVFSELQSHYLFDDRFGRPGKGNDKGKVEGLVGYARRNFFVPIPRFDSWDALNADLACQCRARRRRRLRRRPGRRAPGGDRVRRRQASRAVPPRPPAGPPQSGAVSASAGRPRGHDRGRELPGTPGGRVMTKPTLLLEAHLKALRLPTFLREYDKVARHCAQEGLDCSRYLFRLCELELLDREQRATERRIKAAKFPVLKSLETFEFRAIPSVNKRLVLELTRSEYLDRRENVLALGNSGTGKTHLALALGLAACQKGYRVRFTTAAALVNELLEARDDKRLLRVQKQLAKQDLLIVDELGYVPLSKTGAELLFEIFSQRYEQASTLVTSNRPFNEWTEIFGSERLTGALLDRLTHHVHILELNGESYRLEHSKKARQPAAAPAS